MKIKAISKKIYLEFPKRDLVIAFGQDISAVEKHVGTRYQELDFLLAEPATYPGARCWQISKVGTVLCFVLDSASPSLIAHECFHAAYFLVKDIGAPISDDTEEVVAYLMEYLMRLTLEFQKEIATWK